MHALLLICCALLAETELEACQRLAPKYAASAEVMLPDQSRVDLLSDDTAWEVDWASKWPEGVGQALYYAIWTGKKPGLILLVREPTRDKLHLVRAQLVCQRAGITLRVEASP